MAASAHESPTAPFGVRLVLILALPLLAVILYLDGQRYDPDLLKLEPRRVAAGPDASLLAEEVAGMQRASQVRRFDKESLYEYINGHAEYFLGAGFRGLLVGEYGDAGDGQPALVVNLYDMGQPLNAFGVLVDEAGDQESVDVGTMGFRSGQGLSFILGPYYVQLSLFGDTLPAESAGTDLAGTLSKEVSDAEIAFRFPDLGKITTTRFVKEYYRGMEFLNEILERGFERNGEDIRSFLAQGTEEEIAGLVTAFEKFFEEDEMPYQRVERDGLTFFRIQDPYEGDWFFVPLNETLVGVYAPLDDELAAAIQSFADAGR